MASERFERMQKRQRRWIPDPLYGLPIGNYPYVIHRDDGVEKRYEAFFMMRLSEPCGMIEQTERRPAEKRIEFYESISASLQSEKIDKSSNFRFWCKKERKKFFLLLNYFSTI